MENFRPITITAASISFIVFGVVNVIFAVVIGVALTLFAYANLTTAVALLAGGLIVLIAVLGVMDIVAGYGLWHMKRWASIMGMLLGIFGLISQTFSSAIILGATNYYGFYPSSISYASAGNPYVNIVLVFLIAISWKSFEPSAT